MINKERNFIKVIPNILDLDELQTEFMCSLGGE